MDIGRRWQPGVRRAVFGVLHSSYSAEFYLADIPRTPPTLLFSVLSLRPAVLRSRYPLLIPHDAFFPPSFAVALDIDVVVVTAFATCIKLLTAADNQSYARRART